MYWERGDQFRGQQHDHGYFLWGGTKSMVYGTPVMSEEGLIGRVRGAIESYKTNCTYWVMCVKLSTADVGGSATT